MTVYLWASNEEKKYVMCWRMKNESWKLHAQTRGSKERHNKTASWCEKTSQSLLKWKVNSLNSWEREYVPCRLGNKKPNQILKVIYLPRKSIWEKELKKGEGRRNSLKRLKIDKEYLRKEEYWGISMKTINTQLLFICSTNIHNTY